MERTTSKHGPRLDDALAKETQALTRAGRESRAEEWHMAEPPGEGEPLADSRLTGDLRGGTPSAMPADEVEARAELASSLRPSAFPADAPTLLRLALEDDAPLWVVAVLERVDQVTRFETVGDLWRAAGGHGDAGNGRAGEPGTEAPAILAAPAAAEALDAREAQARREAEAAATAASPTPRRRAASRRPAPVNDASGDVPPDVRETVEQLVPDEGAPQSPERAGVAALAQRGVGVAVDVATAPARISLGIARRVWRTVRGD